MSQRKEEYAEAVAALPPNYFAPFSKAPPTGLLFSNFGKDCLWWQMPTPSSPVVLRHSVYPEVPTLVLDGDLDNQVPFVEARANLFPHSTFFTITGAGHLTIGWSQCSLNLVSEFVETLQVKDTSCARSPETVWPAVGRFPVRSRDAHPAEVDPKGVNEIGLSERKAVTVRLLPQRPLCSGVSSAPATEPDCGLGRFILTTETRGRPH